MTSVAVLTSLPIRQGPPSKATRRNLLRTKRANYQKRSPLFRLPPELRNLIYTHVLRPEVPKNVLRSRLPVESPLEVVDLENAINIGPSNELLATCWRIYNEADGIFIASRSAFWESNTILLDLRDGWEGAAVNEEKPAVDITLLRHDLLCLVPRFVVSVNVGPHNDEYHLIKHTRRRVHSLELGRTGRDPRLDNMAKVLRAQLEHMSIGQLMVDTYRARLSPAYFGAGMQVGKYRSLAKSYIRISSAGTGSMSRMEEQMMRGLADAVRRFVAERERKNKALHHEVLSAVLEHLCERHNVRQTSLYHKNIVKPTPCLWSMSCFSGSC